MFFQAIGNIGVKRKKLRPRIDAQIRVIRWSIGQAEASADPVEEVASIDAA